MTRSRIRKIARVRSAPHSRAHGRPQFHWRLPSRQFSAAPLRYSPRSRWCLGQIIVTAQKREENLQNVPLSVRPSAARSSRSCISITTRDYAAFLPSLSTRTADRAGGSGFARLVHARCGERRRRPTIPPIRQASARTSMSSPSPRSAVHSISMSTISHVWKRWRAAGHAVRCELRVRHVRIITNKPDPTGFKAGYDLQINSARRTVAMAISARASSTFQSVGCAAVRLVGWYEDECRATSTTCTGPSRIPHPASRSTTPIMVKKDYNDGENYGARAALKMDLSDNWTITPSVMGQWSEL